MRAELLAVLVPCLLLAVTSGQEVPCENGDVRLRGGQSKLEGRVEVCLDRRWGTVCDDGWGISDATVVCRQLGYSRFNATSYTGAHFGEGDGPILLTRVGCTGSESNLLAECDTVQTTNCTHSQDAGVQCQPLICGDGDIRLVEGESKLEGRVELCLNEEWNTVCDRGGEQSERIASVACGQQGYSRINVTQSRIPGTTGPVVSLNCPRRAVFGLIGCRFRPATCPHTQDLGVHCSPRICEDGDIRLVQGQSELEGHVEVCQSEQWGTVCDHGWSTSDAVVTCRQLGFSPMNATATVGSTFGMGTGLIHLTDMLCTGSESKLIDCPHSIDTSDCDLSNNAGVVCQEVTSPTPSSVTLFTSPTPSSERSKANCGAVGGGLGAAIVLLVILLLVLTVVLVCLVFKLKHKKFNATKEEAVPSKDVNKNRYEEHQPVYAMPTTGLGGPLPNVTPVHIYKTLEPPEYDKVG